MSDVCPKCGAPRMLEGLAEYSCGSFVGDQFRQSARCEIAALRRWKDAIIEALLVLHIYRAEHERNPEKALAELIAWENAIALDPRVSEPAAKLHQEIAELRAELGLYRAAEASRLV